MRYFLIKDSKKNKNIGIVFHDSTSMSYLIKSSSLSFRNAFEDSISFLRNKPVKVSGKLYARKSRLYDYDWASIVLERTCKGIWEVVKDGELLNTPDEINKLVSKYLTV